MGGHPLIRVCSLSLFLVLFSAAPTYAAGFDFASLRAVLRQTHAESVDELIAALPFTLRSRYTLVFESRSLQGATFTDPRVILYGPDARFVVTFNGDPSQRGFQTIETMEFQPETREFRLRELQFRQRDSGSPAVVVSEVNPERCARCHGTPVRPIWDTHPLWPGAYGEHYGGGLSTAESAGMASFLARQSEHPRYRHLLNIKRFADRTTFRETASQRYNGTQEEPPNAELSNLLAQLQFQSITRNLARQSRFPQFQYALLGTSEGTCGPLEDFYPVSLWHAQRLRFQAFARDTAHANSRQSELKGSRAAIAIGPGATPKVTAPNDLVGVRYVAETGLGVSTRDWTLALETGTYDFTVSPFSMPTMRDALLAEVASYDEKVRELNHYATSADGDRYCNYLKRRSRTGLQGYSAEPDPSGGPGVAAVTAKELTMPEALAQCISCHETGAAPVHPFSHPDLLKSELRAPYPPHGTLLDEIRYRLSPAAGARRMPLGLALSDADIRALQDYFAALAFSPQ